MMTIDPVCKMTVDKKTTPHKAEHMGETYYFCSSGCMKKFGKDPGNYLESGTEMEMPGQEIKEKKPWWKFW